MSDDQVIAMIANGNMVAFEQLYSCTYKSVYAFILSMVKCRQTAEDLMHDTYMRIFKKASSYQNGTNTKTWIMTIAKNLTYDYLRKMKPLLAFDKCRLENTVIHQNGIDDNVIKHIELEKSFEGLSGLDSKIAVLYAVCGYKHREIAQILSIPEGTVRRRYRGAIKRLADAMGGEADG